MRVSSQLLRSRASRPLHSTELIDLSHLQLVSVERLELCPKLQTLNLRENRVEAVPNLDCCPQLWNIDLANNKLRSLEGFCKFPAFGTLILSNNELDWNELQKIRHMHILDITLHGNPVLETDAYYRLHVIDSLPNIWMLDGRIITSAERAQVDQFFKDTALCDRPVRHKLPRNQFIPTSLRNIKVTGVHGHRTDHLMRHFPSKNTWNIDLDKRRLQYLAYNLQQDVNLYLKYNTRGNIKASTLIENLIAWREIDQERCNMILLLLVGSLEFSIPLSLMQRTLEVAKLKQLENIETMDLFMFSRETRSRIASLLLSAVKIERDQTIDGGLYNRLYLALYDLVSDLIRLANGDDITRYQTVRRKFDTRKSGYRSLLASEIVQLLCIVPVFFDLIGKDPGIMDLISIATKNPDIGDQIKAITWKVQSNGGNINNVYQEVFHYLVKRTKEVNSASSNPGKEKSTVNSDKNDDCPDYSMEPSYIITSKHVVKVSPKDRPWPLSGTSQATRSNHHQRAATASGLRTAGSAKPGLTRAKTARRRPRLGDRVQLGHQAWGRLVALPENYVGLVQLDTLAASRFQQADHNLHSKFDNQFHYVNFKLMEWNYKTGKWQTMAGLLSNYSLLSKDRGRQFSDGGRQSSDRDNSKFLSEVLQQTLKLRIDLPFVSEKKSTHEPDDQHHEGGQALITDHVRSIVRECLEEAEVQWTDDKNPEAVEQSWTEPAEHMESQADHSEVTVHVDSDSFAASHELNEDETTERMSEANEQWNHEEQVDTAIPRNLPSQHSIHGDVHYPIIHMYQPNHHHTTSHTHGEMGHPHDQMGHPHDQMGHPHDQISHPHGDQVEELVSHTENARLDAWRSIEVMNQGSSSGIPSRVGSATLSYNTVKATEPPPQRPSSPIINHIHIKRADCWLAGGRDVSAAQVCRRTPHLPGWMEGLEESRRPKSSPGNSIGRQLASPNWTQMTQPQADSKIQRQRVAAAPVFRSGQYPPSVRIQSARVFQRKR